MTPDEKFGQAVQVARESHGWSMTHFAAQLDAAGLGNFHAATIGRMERAQRPVRLSEAVVIAEVLDRSLEELLGGPNEQLRMADDFRDRLRWLDAATFSLGSAYREWLSLRTALTTALDDVEEAGVDRVDAASPGVRDLIPEARRLLAITLDDVTEPDLMY